MRIRTFLIILFFIPAMISCSYNKSLSEQEDQEALYSFSSNINGEGRELLVELYKGPEFYYPLFAIWLEDMDGNYIQTLYVAKSVATSTYMYGEAVDGEWQPGIQRWPQTLPYWAHRRGVKASDGLYMPEADNPVPDAYTGPTPVKGFILNTKADNKLTGDYRLMLEINQNWDWNEYWTNDKYPDDEYYMRSCQPALVYEAVIDSSVEDASVKMNVIGHSHYSGANGELFTDLSTISTALQIADSIIVRY